MNSSDHQSSVIPEPPALLDALMESVACGVLITDSALRIVRVNESAEAITGIPLSEARGRPCRDVLRPGGRTASCPLELCVRHGRSHDERTLTMLGRDDIELTVRVVSRVIRDDAGNMLGGLLTFGDLSTVHDLRLRLDRRSVFHGMISQNHRMRALFDVMPRMAQSNSTVLIRGDTGTGKELFARAIHELSDRAGRPFVSVNTAALPDTLLEAELFGHVKGAFTDAKSDRQGRIAVAQRGTLFLDEIGDLSPAMQVKLLRFLQDRVYEPLGSSRPRDADVRVIAATNRNLEEMIARGRFREDFYYRLNVLTIEIPPLRDRSDDIPLLIEHFLQRLNLIEGDTPLAITPLALQALVSYEYPGNVRELENIIERAAILADGTHVDFTDLPLAIRNRTLRATSDAGGGELVPSSMFTPMELGEREVIRERLALNGGNRKLTAEGLGISRTTLWRKMKKYRLA
ncbi:MAG: Transcriptional regulatory protein ZraR [Calditrichaeota bacterium]|nr:Transcriptional regulatory protein ZraR [Calditrichota bacterium]